MNFIFLYTKMASVACANDLALGPSTCCLIKLSGRRCSSQRSSKAIKSLRFLYINETHSIYTIEEL